MKNIYKGKLSSPGLSAWATVEAKDIQEAEKLMEIEARKKGYWLDPHSLHFLEVACED